MRYPTRSNKADARDHVLMVHDDLSFRLSLIPLFQQGRRRVRCFNQPTQRLDRLRVEGFLHAREVPRRLDGFAATLSVDLGQSQPVRFAGRIRFASPEIDPVNGQFRFWAEIENPELLLRPGQQGTLTIDLGAPLK